MGFLKVREVMWPCLVIIEMSYGDRRYKTLRMSRHAPASDAHASSSAEFATTSSSERKRFIILTPSGGPGST